MPAFKKYLVCAVCLAAASTAAHASADCARVIPPDAVLFTYLIVKENDPGQKWVFDRLTRYLMERAQGEKGRKGLKDIDLCRFKDFCFALLPPDKQKHERMLMAATLAPSDGTFGISYGNQKFQLQVRNTATATRTQSQIITYLLGLACRIPAGSAPQAGVYANAENERKGKFAAYAVSDDMAVMGTDRRIVREAITQKAGAVTLPAFRETIALLPRGWDAYGYLRNEGSTLTGILAEKGQGWRTLLFMLLAPARRVAMALDVADKDNSSVVLVLIPNDKANIHELRVRLEQTLALLLSQYLDSRIKSSIRYEELPNVLKISAQLSGTSSFWNDVFRTKQGVSRPAHEAAAKENSKVDAEGEDGR